MNFPSLARRAASVLNTLITLPDEDARALVLRTESADEMEDAQMEAAMALSALRIAPEPDVPEGRKRPSSAR